MPEWEAKGYVGGGNVAELIDSAAGTPALVAGSARGVFDEVDRATSVFGGHPLTFAANDVGVLLPRLDHFVSLHTARLDFWVAIRRDPTGSSYGNIDFRVHDGGLYGVRPWYQWKELTPTMSLSGMFAAQIAYLMGCQPIVLCGCPNDDTPRFWETISRSKDYCKAQASIKQEMEYKPDFKNVVRAMSGWSKSFFGGME
jgi:hypothetical protein